MKHLDLFSGIGGFALAAMRVGWETVGFCEIDPYCQKVLNKHWPGVPIYEDVTALDGERLRADGIEPSIITGGFPCQDISYAGKGAGIAGSRSGLWTDLCRIIGDVRPRYALLENVSALLSRGLDKVLGDLAQVGYDAEWHCIQASDVGAPHLRDRIWIIAYPQHPDTDSPGSHREEMHQYRSIESRNQQVNVSRQVCEVLADTISERLQRLTIAGKGKETSREILARCQIAGAYSENREHRGIWEPEPNVGRVAHGVSNRVDRLKGLGNAIVPQVAEIIFRAIDNDHRSNLESVS